MQDTKFTIGSAGTFLLGYGARTLDANQTTGLIIMGLGVALLITVAILQKAGLNVQMNQG